MARSSRRATPLANQLLAALPRRDYGRLLARLTPVPLKHAATLYEAGEEIRHVYFPESGLVSLVAPMAIINVLLNGVAAKSTGSADRYQQIFRLLDEWNAFFLKGNADG